MPLYKKWVPRWAVHLCNFFLVMVFTNALLMNIIGYDMSQVQGHFGATPEEFQLSIQLPFAIMLILVPLAMALSARLPLQPLFLFSGLATGFFYMACLFSPNIYWFTFFKTGLCCTGLVALLCTIIPVMLTYNPTFHPPMMFAILYSVAFGLADIFKFIGTYMISRFNWEYGFLFFTSLILVAVLVIFIFFKKERVLPKPAGSGSLDLPGLTMLLCLFCIVVFILVHGPNELWFESRLIRGLAALSVTLLGLYLYYSVRKKDCYVQWQIFTYKNTLIGGFLLIAAGFLMSTGGALNNLMGISGFNNISMGRAYLPEVAGVFSASIICVAAIRNKFFLSMLMVLGFVSLSLFHLTMFLQFYPGIGSGDFFWPLMLRGAGQVFLYLSLGIYVAENIPKPLSGSRVIVSVFFKIIVGTFIGGAAFGYFMARNKVQHQTGISQQVTANNPLALQEYNKAKQYSLSRGADEKESEQFATKMLASKVNQPATLTADKDLYLVCGLVSLILALLVGWYKRLRHSPGTIVVEPVPL